MTVADPPTIVQQTVHVPAPPILVQSTRTVDDPEVKVQSTMTVADPEPKIQKTVTVESPSALFQSVVPADVTAALDGVMDVAATGLTLGTLNTLGVDLIKSADNSAFNLFINFSKLKARLDSES